MSRILDANFNQKLLFPPTVEDWITLNHPARFIREFVAALDMTELGFKPDKDLTDVGGVSYANGLLLRIWLYGYVERIRSARKLEKACRDHLGFIWLSGNQQPDHITLWRFFRDNKKALKKLFKRVLQVAIDLDLVGFVVQALDGTKIAADVSKTKGVLHQDILTTRAQEVDQEIEKIVQEIETQQKQEPAEGYLLSAEVSAQLATQKDLQETVKAQLAALEQEETNHLSVTDPDARMMKMASGGTILGYNAQAVRDAKAGIIVAAEVVQDASDQHQLTPMLDEVHENTGRVAELTVVDKGYCTGEELDACENRAYNVVAPNASESLKSPTPKTSTYHVSQFTHHPETDTYTCPQGGMLKFERVKKYSKRGSYQTRVYRCTHAKSCPFRAECSKSGRTRRIEVSQYHAALVRNANKGQEPQNREALKQRKQIIEPLFGHIKRNWGFRRWTYRGLESVKAQWYLICTAVNLTRIFAAWEKCVQKPKFFTAQT